MNDSIEMRIDIPTDDHGMVGRECPECEAYFKLKPGTGLQDIETTACPYCGHQADSSDFTTQAQIDYAISVATKKILGPEIRKLQRSFKRLERSTRGSLIQIKVSTSPISFPIKYYIEDELETAVKCDYCDLEFAIFGVFALCPDCLRPNSMSMFLKSIEVISKRLLLIENIPPEESDMRDGVIVDSISACVSTFDSLGKRLRSEYPEMLPSRPRNLFQNLNALEEALESSIGFDLENHLGAEKHGHLRYMFQVRHIWNHNFGEADEDFIEKTGSDPSLLGLKIVPDYDLVELLIEIVKQVGVDVRKKLGDSA